jgi:hypothetical protein
LGFTAFEPFGLWPAVRAADGKNESSRFAFFSRRKGGKNIPAWRKFLDLLLVSFIYIEKRYNISDIL